MSTNFASNISSLGSHLKENNDNIDDDSILYLENAGEKEKEETYFRNVSSDFQEAFLEKTKDEKFGKVYNSLLVLNIFLIF